MPEREDPWRASDEAKQNLPELFCRAHEELGQRLAVIALAVHTVEKGGNLADAMALIKTAVEEAKRELRAFRCFPPQLTE